MLNY